MQLILVHSESTMTARFAEQPTGSNPRFCTSFSECMQYSASQARLANTGFNNYKQAVNQALSWKLPPLTAPQPGSTPHVDLGVRVLHGFSLSMSAVCCVAAADPDATDGRKCCSTTCQAISHS